MFRHEVKESQTVISKQDYYTAKIEGYDVIFEHDNNGARLKLYPNSEHHGIRLGLIECCPDNVADLEQFADHAATLFRGIARELRALGKSDLRSKWEIEHEDLMESLSLLNQS